MIFRTFKDISGNMLRVGDYVVFQQMEGIHTGMTFGVVEHITSSDYCDVQWYHFQLEEFETATLIRHTDLIMVTLTQVPEKLRPFLEMIRDEVFLSL